MTLIERIRFRLHMLWLGLTMKPIAGADGEGEGGGEPEPQPQPAGEEPGEEPLDLERAKAKIRKANSEAENLRKRLKELEPLAEKAKELEEASKSDQEKLTERASKAEAEAKSAAQEALRLRVALRKGLAETQAKRLVGETEEELEADADDLIASFKPEGEGDAPRRPRERQRPGAVPSSEPEEPKSPRELASQLPRY